MFVFFVPESILIFTLFQVPQVQPQVLTTIQPRQYTYQVYDTVTVQPEVQSPTRKYGFSFIEGSLATEPPSTTVNPYTYKVENNPATVQPNVKKYGFDFLDGQVGCPQW